MYMSKLEVENFRQFGEGENAFVLHLNGRVTALVGENDAGKTAVIDAIRMVLGTRDQEYMRVQTTDFHYNAATKTYAENISICCTFDGLTASDRGAFAEHLSYLTFGETVLHVTWTARRMSAGNRRFIPTEWRPGHGGEGQILDGKVRALLTATYLRPLRDAERALSAGRGSRLAQILQNTKEVKSHGVAFDIASVVRLDPASLSLVGLLDYTNHHDWDPTIEGVGTNRYAYAENDPVNKSDPNGYATTPDAGKQSDKDAKDSIGSDKNDGEKKDASKPLGITLDTIMVTTNAEGKRKWSANDENWEGEGAGGQLMAQSAIPIPGLLMPPLLMTPPAVQKKTENYINSESFEQPEPVIRMRHYTSKSRMYRIMAEGRIIASDQNRIFAVPANSKRISPQSVIDKYGIEPTRGNAYIEFDTTLGEFVKRFNSRMATTEWVKDGDIDDLDARQPTEFLNR